MMPYSCSNRSGNVLLRVLGSIVLLAAVAALFVFTVPKSKTENVENNDVVSEASKLNRRCEDELTSLLELMVPGRLGVSVDRDTVVNRLNAWRADCLKNEILVKTGEEVATAERLLTGTALSRTVNDKFLPEDVAYIRNSLFFRDIVGRLTEARPNNSDRYQAIFNFVCRHQLLIPDEFLKNFPMTPYESIVFGVGSIEHRTWIFNELLRQMRVDVVVISPKNNESNWLIGVIDPRDGVYLFDPRIGMPIPALDDKGIATLAQVKESDAHFRKLDVEGLPYPLKSEDFASVNVSYIGTSSNWAPRMAQIQYLLPVKFGVELYDGLVESDLRSPGQQQRIIDSGAKGDWSEGDVKIWGFSEEQLIAFEETRGIGAKGSPLEGFNNMFRGPLIPDRNFVPTEEDKVPFRLIPIDHSLQYVRVLQLKGDYAGAIRDYLPIRTAAKMAPTPENLMASEYATLWTGIAQFESRRFQQAYSTLRRFVSDQASSTSLIRAGLEWASDSLVGINDPLNAAKLLESAPQSEDPRRDLLLIRSWYKQAGVEPPKKPAATPETEVPAEPETKKDEAMKAETSPAEDSKPADTKPAEAKPAEEMKANDAPKTDEKEPQKEAEKTPVKPEAPKEPQPATEPMTEPKTPADKPAGDTSEGDKADAGSSEESPAPSTEANSEVKAE